MPGKRSKNDQNITNYMFLAVIAIIFITLISTIVYLFLVGLRSVG